MEKYYPCESFLDEALLTGTIDKLIEVLYIHYGIFYAVEMNVVK